MLFKKGDEDEGTKEEVGSVNFAKAFRALVRRLKKWAGGGREGEKKRKKLKKWMQIH